MRGWKRIFLQGFTFPNDVGLPIGDKDGTRVMMFEIHYDNPLKKAGDTYDEQSNLDYPDSSGPW